MYILLCFHFVCSVYIYSVEKDLSTGNEGAQALIEALKPNNTLTEFK